MKTARESISASMTSFDFHEIFGKQAKGVVRQIQNIKSKLENCDLRFSHYFDTD